MSDGQIPRSALDVLILRMLSLGPAADGVLVDRMAPADASEVQAGLQRLLQKRLVRLDCRVTEDCRRERLFTLTAAGLQRLAEKAESGRLAAAAVARALKGYGGNAAMGPENAIRESVSP